MTGRIRLCFVAGLCAVAAIGAQAQHKPLPPTTVPGIDSVKRRTETKAIALPEYTITGADMIRLREGGKEALDAFDPSALVARAGRGIRELPEGAPALTQPVLGQPLLLGRAGNLFARATLGLFATPALDVRAAQQFEHGDAFARAALERSNGHTDHADRSSASIEGGGGSFLPATLPAFFARSRVEGQVSAEYRAYSLYGDRIDPGSPALLFSRKRSGFSFSSGLISRQNRIVDHNIVFGVEHTNLREGLAVADSFTVPESRFADTRVQVSARARTRLRGFPLEGGLEASIDYVRAPSGLATTRPFFLAGSARSQWWIRPDLSLDGGLALTLYRGSNSAAQGRIYPDLELRYYWDADLSVAAAVTPRVERVTYHGIFDENPYTSLDAELRHDDIPVAIALSARFDDRRRLAFDVSAEYREYATHGVFIRSSEPYATQWDVRYPGRASIFTLHSDAQWQATRLDRVAAFVELRSSYIRALDAAVPYLPAFELHGVYTRGFDIPLEVQAGLRLLGPRTADAVTLASTVLVDVQAEYRFTPFAAAYASVQNIFGSRWERYRGYSERPLFLAAGITVRL